MQCKIENSKLTKDGKEKYWAKFENIPSLLEIKIEIEKVTYSEKSFIVNSFLFQWNFDIALYDWRLNSGPHT
jgi:hypothetical protein